MKDKALKISFLFVLLILFASIIIIGNPIGDKQVANAAKETNPEIVVYNKIVSYNNSDYNFEVKVVVRIEGTVYSKNNERNYYYKTQPNVIVYLSVRKTTILTNRSTFKILYKINDTTTKELIASTGLSDKNWYTSSDNLGKIQKLEFLTGYCASNSTVFPTGENIPNWTDLSVPFVLIEDNEAPTIAPLLFISDTLEDEAHYTQKSILVFDPSSSSSGLKSLKYSKNALSNSNYPSTASINISVEDNFATYEFVDEGKYYIEARDNLDNKSSIRFTIDKTQPSISGVADDSYYQGNRNIYVSDYNLVYSKYSRKNNNEGFPGEATINFSSGTTFSQEGKYLLEAMDQAGNINRIRFCIDKTKPTISSVVSNGGFTNVIKNVTSSDHNLKKVECMKPGTSSWVQISSNYSIEEINGLWKFKATDKADNVSEIYQFTFDNIKPVLSSENALNSFVKTQKKVTTSDANHLNFSYKEPGKDWIVISDSSFTGTNTNGLWQFKATDKAGNVSDIYKFTFDNINPTGELQESDGSAMTNFFVNRNFKYVGSDTNYLKTQVKLPGTNVWIDYNGETSQSNLIEGVYYFRTIDKAGNISEESSIEADLTDPIIALKKANNSALVDGGFTNLGVYFEPIDKNYDSLILKKSINENWVIISSEYIVGTIYYDSRENKEELFSSHAECLEYIYRKEAKRVLEKTNWSIAVPGIIPDNQVDLAVTGYNYYEYTLDTGEVYIFFDYNALVIFVRNKASSYIASESRSIFSEEGCFKVEVTDKAGNMSFKIFTIDRQIPTGAFLNLANGAVTNLDIVEFRFEKKDVIITDTINGEIKIKEQTYEVESSLYKIQLTEEGWHNLTLEDKAGNISNYSIYIDRTPANAYHAETVLSNITYTNSGTYSITVKDDVELREVLLNGNISYKYDAELNNQARQYVLEIQTELLHEIKITDKAGNISIFNVCVDRTKPEVIYSGSFTQEGEKIYNNCKMGIEATDDRSGVLEIFIKNQKTGEITTLSFTQEISVEDGSYLIRVKDKSGNIKEYEYIKYTNNEFGNIEKIRKEYKIISYYKVTLPAYVFNRPGLPNISGQYNFKNHDDAVSFARTKEREYRVQQTGENEWIYISGTNESVSQKYINEQQLNAIVNMYADRYVSDRIISKEYSSGISGILVNENDFIVNNVSIPTYLDGFENMEIYEIKHSFVFSIRNNEYNVQSKARLTYLADDFAVQTEKIIEVFAGESVLEALNRNDFKIQGYYLVEEYDKCLNSFKYLAYLDFEKPKMSVEIIRGDNTKENITLDDMFATTNVGCMRYVSFKIEDLLDNIDEEHVVVRIEGKNIDKSFLKGDVIPRLYANLGYSGKYLITIYDRSNNILKFEIIIAGDIPTWSYTSLSENTDYFRITFNINDPLNSFESINIYKIAGSGAKIKIEADSENTSIDASNIYYKFITGGKYQAEMLDLYGRTIWTKPIFYLKGLPKGLLNISDGSLTNKDVVFSFDTKYEALLYTTSGEEKTLFEDYLVLIDEASQRKTITVIAKEGIDRVPYLIYLYDKTDINTFVEYTFGIDTVISPITIKEKDTGKIINKSGSTNKGVVIDYEDSDLIIRYLIDGKLKRYYRGDIITEDGLYSFTIQDIVGNKEEFSLYIDTLVRYKISGEYIVIEDGILLSRNLLNLDVLEAISRYEVKGTNLKQGDPFVDDGVYEITIEDNYGNIVEIVIEIDTTVPNAHLSGLNEGSNKTKNKVSVHFDKDATAYLYRSFKLIKKIEPGEEVDSEGIYRIVVQDRAGNKTTLTFEIDRTVDAMLNIPNMSITTSRVYLQTNENVSIEVFKNGEKTDPASNFSEEGEYKIVIKDLVGNEKELCFLIIGTEFNELDLPVFKDSKIISIQKDGLVINHEGNIFTQTGKYEVTMLNLSNEEFKISFLIDSDKPTLDVIRNKDKSISFKNCSKDGVKAVLYKDGVEINNNFTLTSNIKDAGAYTLVITDSYGNVNEYTFEIKKYLNSAGIAGISIACAVFLVALAVGIIAKLKMKAR